MSKQEKIRTMRTKRAAKEALATAASIPAGPQGLTGPKGDTGLQGPAGSTGPAGQGVPVGGTTGQVLTKVNSTDYNTQWSTPVGSGSSDPWTYVSLANDFLNSTTSFSDVTGMSFSALANTAYEVEIFGGFRSAATTTGLALVFNIPSGSIVGGTLISSSTTAPQYIQQNTSGAALANSGSSGVVNADIPLLGKYLISVGATPGTVQLRLRSEVAASAVTLRQNLKLKYRSL